VRGLPKTDTRVPTGASAREAFRERAPWYPRIVQPDRAGLSESTGLRYSSPGIRRPYQWRCPLMDFAFSSLWRYKYSRANRPHLPRLLHRQREHPAQRGGNGQHALRSGGDGDCAIPQLRIHGECARAGNTSDGGHQTAEHDSRRAVGQD